MPPGRLSIILPALNEAAGIDPVLRTLQTMRRRGAEIIVVDGGSADATVAIACPLADRVVAEQPGRARQMNAGTARSSGDALLFLHADTMLPPDADRQVLAALSHTPGSWGRFDVAIAGRSPLLRVVAATMNVRSRLSGIATGDQALFMTRAAYERVGGFPEQPIMEDVEMSSRLRALSRPICLRGPAVTSGRRWERDGVWRTVFLMWRLRWRYARGESPVSLAEDYR